MVEMDMFNVKRAITPKAGISELQFMCSAHCFIVLYLCMKFHENISDVIRVMEQTRMIEALTDVWMDTQNFAGYNIIPSLLFMAGHRKGKSVRLTEYMWWLRTNRLVISPHLYVWKGSTERTKWQRLYVVQTVGQITGLLSANSTCAFSLYDNHKASRCQRNWMFPSWNKTARGKHSSTISVAV